MKKFIGFFKSTPDFQPQPSLLTQAWWPVPRCRRASGAVSAFALLVAAVALHAAPAEPNTSVAFLKAPEGAKLFSVSLAVSENLSSRGSSGYLTQRSAQPLEPLGSIPTAIAEKHAGKEFTAYQIAALPGGTRYLLCLNQDKKLKSLNRNDALICLAEIYRLPPGADSQPELIKEGYQTSTGDITFPVELVSASGIGATHVKTFQTELGYNITSGFEATPQVYAGQGAAFQVSGSQVTDKGKLTLTINIPLEMAPTPDTSVTLRFEPLEPSLPQQSAAGKLNDFLDLGHARFLVSAVAPDFSSATLALVAGNLDATLDKQLQLGTQMPPFAQVELVTRKTVTQQELLAKARAASGVLFIFGDLAPGNRPGNPYNPAFRSGGINALPLSPDEVMQQATLDLNPKPIVVFVTRQIGVDFLYDDLRNKTPEYLVLADFADPLRTSFRQPQSMGAPWMGMPYSGAQQEPCLRQLFNLPLRLCIAAFDSRGKVRYVNADAAPSFLNSLAEARTALGARK